jgi:hypothetical protein
MPLLTKKIFHSIFPSGCSISLTFADLVAVANAAFRRLPGFWNNQLNIAQP